MNKENNLFRSITDFTPEKPDPNKQTHDINYGNIIYRIPEDPTKLLVFLFKNGYQIKNESFVPYEPEKKKPMKDGDNIRTFVTNNMPSKLPDELIYVLNVRLMLEKMMNTGIVGVQFIDRRHEDYKNPDVEEHTTSSQGLSNRDKNTIGSEKKLHAFTGIGKTLGEMVPSSGVDNINKEVKVDLDETSEITEIRIRLHNGDTVVQKFNLTHKLSHIYSYVEK